MPINGISVISTSYPV